MKDIAIIVSVTPARFLLLRRSLQTWQQSIEASGLNCEICLFIEGATICEALQYIPNGVGCKIEGGTAKSGSHVRGYNFWLERIKAKTYVLTHPELLFPTNTVMTAFNTTTLNNYVTFKCFWLPQYVTENLNNYPWQHPEQLEQFEDIYKLDAMEKGSDYWNRDIRGLTKWESTTCYAMDYLTIRKMLPFPDFGAWGSDDLWHLQMRKALGIPTVTIMEPILCHQWHPQSDHPTTDEIIRQAQQAVDERLSQV